MMSSDRKELDGTSSNFLTYKMTIQLNMFSSFMKNWIGSNVDYSLVVAKEKG